MACAKRLAQSSLYALIITLISQFALAQSQTQPLAPDDTNTPAAQQFASQSTEKEKDKGAETDDPAARAEWLQHVFSDFNPSARDNYLQQVNQQRQLYPGLAAQPPSVSTVSDTSSVSFGGASYAPSTGAGPRWINIGPTRADFATNGSFGLVGAIDSGRARVILPHPTDPNTVYFLTSGGGLWKTTNFHSNPPNWIPLNDSLATTSGGSAAFGVDPNTLYLGLGDPYDQTLPGGVIVKTNDGGATWSGPITLGGSLSVRDVKVDTSTAQEIVLVATDTGVWRSGDSGATYQQVVGGGGLIGWSLAKTGAGWLASVQPCAATLVVKEACGTATTLLLSTDLGQTWNPISNAGNVFSNVSRTTLAVGNSGDAIVYALSGNLTENGTANVFRSTDGGQTWVALGVNNTRAPTNPNSDQPNLDVLHGQSWYNQMILVDPTNTNVVYIGGNLSSLKTSDGGATWSVISNWLYSQFPGVPYVHADFHAAAFSTLGGNNTVFFGSDGGLFVSTNGGATFDSSRNENLITHLFYSIAATPSFPNVVYGGLQDNGTRVQTDGTSTFNGVLGGDGVSAGWSQANANTSVGGVNGSARFNLTNQPPNTIWDWLSLGLPTDDFLPPVTFPRATADPTGTVVYVASASLIRKLTINTGFAQNIIYNRTSHAGAPTVRSSPHNIGVSPFDLNRVAFGGAGGFLGVTVNGGDAVAGGTWSFFNLISMFPPGGANGAAGFQGFIYNVVWQDNNNLFISAASQIPGSIHVLKGTLSGSSWSFARADAGLPGVSVQKIVVDPTDPTNNTLYAATDLGVYRSTDGGNSWSQYGAGLPAVRVSDLYVAPNGSYIKIATYGRGLWELPGLEFRNATLVDDGSGADGNGILDNGEGGHLSVTVHNNSGSTLSQVTAAVSANTPALAFPNGNTIVFPSIAPGADGTASVPVALNNASTNQQVDFTLAYGDPALNLPSAVAATKSLHVNFREGSGTFDDVEAPDTAWTVVGPTPSAPDVFNWERRQIQPSQHRWAITDGNAVSDNSLVSPSMHVGAGTFSFSFSHRFLFESGAISGVTHFFDGGVIELSTDGGVSWNDIGASATPTYNATLDGGLNPLGGRRAYGGNSGIPNFTTVNVNLGTTYAGQDVKIRFRVGTDENTGSQGWELDNFVFNGITNSPFIVNVANPAKDVTGQINIVQSGYGYNPVTKRFSQTITLTNNTGSDVSGPVSYVLDNLSSNATVVSPSGMTTSSPPLGSPYVNVNIGSSGVFSSGASATVVVQFNDPTRTAITYTPRVLAGSGPR